MRTDISDFEVDFGVVTGNHFSKNCPVVSELIGIFTNPESVKLIRQFNQHLYQYNLCLFDASFYPIRDIYAAEWFQF